MNRCRSKARALPFSIADSVRKFSYLALPDLKSKNPVNLCGVTDGRMRTLRSATTSA